MITENLHDFHFIMVKGMKDNFRNLDIYKKTGSLSGVIVKILTLLGPAMNRKHQWGEQRMSRYMWVSSDPEEVREDVHVYLPVDLYRRLKLMYADLNWYSIAQMVRGFLAFFIGLVKKFGATVYQELKKLFKQWEEEKMRNRLTPRKLIRQLWRIIQHIKDQNRLINIYNGQYSPFWVFRL